MAVWEVDRRRDVCCSALQVESELATCPAILLMLRGVRSSNMAMAPLHAKLNMLSVRLMVFLLSDFFTIKSWHCAEGRIYMFAL